MSERRSDDGEQLDLATISRDDQLLDAIARGERAPDGDDLAMMLAAWHGELGDGGSDADSDARTVDDRPRRNHRRVRARRSPLLGRRILRLAAAALAVVALATGLGAGSRSAGPTSPLWSLTKVLHPQQAQVREVEHTMERARAAAAEGQLDEARELLHQAGGELSDVRDPAAVTRLRAELDALLGELTLAVTPPSPPGLPIQPTPTTPSLGTPTATRPPGTRSMPAAPETSVPSRRTSPLEDLPLPPPPSLPAPLPIPPVRETLPALPLPTGGLLD